MEGDAKHGMVVGGKRCVRHTTGDRCTAIATHRVQVGTYAGAYYLCDDHVHVILERELKDLAAKPHDLAILVDRLIFEKIPGGRVVRWDRMERIARIKPKPLPWRPVS